MADDVKASSMIASINDLAYLVESLKSGALKDIISRVGPSGLADCSGHCVCVGSMCGCNHIVSAREWSDLSYPAFLAQREARVRELKTKLEELETPPESKR